MVQQGLEQLRRDTMFLYKQHNVTKPVLRVELQNDFLPTAVCIVCQIWCDRGHITIDNTVVGGVQHYQCAKKSGLFVNTYTTFGLLPDWRIIGQLCTMQESRRCVLAKVRLIANWQMKYPLGIIYKLIASTAAHMW